MRRAILAHAGHDVADGIPADKARGAQEPECMRDT